MRWRRYINRPDARIVEHDILRRCDRLHRPAGRACRWRHWRRRARRRRLRRLHLRRDLLRRQIDWGRWPRISRPPDVVPRRTIARRTRHVGDRRRWSWICWPPDVVRKATSALTRRHWAATNTKAGQRAFANQDDLLLGPVQLVIQNAADRDFYCCQFTLHQCVV